MPKTPAPAAATTDRADAVSQELCRRVRELRAERGWSLDVLSKACGVSRSMLSEIERERANPTLGVAVRIARAFGLSLGELIEPGGPRDEIGVIRAEDPASVYRNERGVRIRTLSPLNLEKDVEFYELVFQPDSELRSAPHFEGTREFLTVEKGKVTVESGETCATLSRGDSASYRADVPHCITNAGKGEAVVFLVVIYK
ncbi:MAG: XRE family transcriptional regulator [Planctomycetaceae bacterium]